jgi:hypothetical protein
MRCLTLNECQQWRKKHCRRDEWKRQSTCVRPLKRLPWYTAVLVGPLQPFDHALLIIDQVVFKIPPEPKSVVASRASSGRCLKHLDTRSKMTVKGFERHLQRRCQDGSTCALYSRPPSTRYGTSMTSTRRFLPGPQRSLLKFVACSAKAECGWSSTQRSCPNYCAGPPHDRQPVMEQQALGRVFVHGGRRREHVRAHVRHAGQFGLHRPVRADRTASESKGPSAGTSVSGSAPRPDRAPSARPRSV